jgi:hypothetical protein
MVRDISSSPFKPVGTMNKSHHQAILEAFQGRSDQLRETPAARLDWAGTGMILQLFERTSGKDRASFIEAVGRIIEEHPLPPAAIAELIHIASSLDLAQVEPQVRKLQTQVFASQKNVKRAITNYLALRDFSASAQTPIISAGRSTNGAPGPLKASGKRPTAHRKVARK